MIPFSCLVPGKTLLQMAIEFATTAHERIGQIRKSDGTPYIFHPLAVARYVAEAGGSNEQIVIALLHDVIEDTDVTGTEISVVFGADVAKAVQCLSESKAGNWHQRKQGTLLAIKSWPLDAKVAKLADTLDNLQGLHSQLLLGRDIWLEFTQGKTWQFWYHRGVLSMVNLPFEVGHNVATELWNKCDDLIKKLWSDEPYDDWIKLDLQAQQIAKK